MVSLGIAEDTMIARDSARVSDEVVNVLSGGCQ